MSLKLKQKIKFISCLDNIRWNDANKEKYNFEISFYAYPTNLSKEMNDNAKKLLAEKILLTHWLLYICDRQMDYRHIFKAGGYIISKIVNDFYKLNTHKSFDDFFNSFCDFYKEKVNNSFKPKVRLKVDAINNPLNKKQQNIIDYFNEVNLTENNFFYFSSRFTSVDICCIYKTLQKINANKELFINCLKLQCDKEEIIRDIAYKLYNLTYRNIGQPSVNDIHKNGKLTINEYLKLREKSNTIHNDFDVHKAKRIWCVIRDMFYHPIFSECYRIILGMNESEFNLYKQQQIKNIELPGDVWNNNQKFAKCFWGEEMKPKNSSKFLRIQFNRHKDYEAYGLPIHFDITFNYVPRMCSSDKCSICPMNSNPDQKDEFKNICHGIKDKICPFILYSTDLTHKCSGIDECEILECINN